MATIVDLAGEYRNEPAKSAPLSPAPVDAHLERDRVMHVLRVIKEGRRNEYRSGRRTDLLEEEDRRGHVVASLGQGQADLGVGESLANVSVGVPALREVVQLRRVDLVQKHGVAALQLLVELRVLKQRTLGPPNPAAHAHKRLFATLHLDSLAPLGVQLAFAALFLQAERGEVVAVANLQPVAIRIFEEELNDLALGADCVLGCLISSLLVCLVIRSVGCLACWLVGGKNARLVGWSLGWLVGASELVWSDSNFAERDSFAVGTDTFWRQCSCLNLNSLIAFRRAITYAGWLFLFVG